MNTRGSRISALPSSSSGSGSCRSMTRMRFATPTWIAASPIPGASYIVSNMSAISVLSSASNFSTGLEMTRSRGSGVSMMGRMAMACRYELECPTSTHRPPRPQRLRQRPLVEIIQLAAHGQTMRELRQPYRITLEPLGEIMCGRLPLQRRVHREHDLVDPAGGDARDQGIDAEVLRANAFQRREPADRQRVV